MIHVGDCREVLRTLPERSVQCVVTSPPYWGLRDYGVDGQLGLEQTPDEYVATMVEVFRDVWRVLRDDGTCWVNMGDSYAGGGGYCPDAPSNRAGSLSSRGAGHGGCKTQGATKVPTGLKPKDLVGIPWRLAFALQADGWYLRSDIVWSKPNPMPESVTDRPTKAHEYVFLLTKAARYFYDADAVREATGTECATDDYAQHLGSDILKAKRLTMGMSSPKRDGFRPLTHPLGRNRRSVWTIPTQPFSKAHFATFPEKLVEPCIMAGTSEKGCCPECGAPWKRIIEKDRKPTRPGTNTKCDAKTWDKDGLECIPGRRDGNVIGNRDPKRHTTETRTVGWEPGCRCLSDDVVLLSGEPDDGTPVPFDPIPCTVLDPFAGSGTVGVVCRKSGRNFIGIELNPEYAQMARLRIANPEPEPEVADVVGQQVLFDASTPA